MLLLYIFVMLLALHWLLDFVFQTDWQAQNKSKNNKALTAHVVGYTVGLLCFSLTVFPSALNALVFASLNGALHFGTDYVTSRLSAAAWERGNRHDFFVLVGFDQLIHQVTLAVTLVLFW